ncbi:uncharacterized protein LOC144301118 [Canis aureus]
MSYGRLQIGFASVTGGVQARPPSAGLLTLFSPRFCVLDVFCNKGSSARGHLASEWLSALSGAHGSHLMDSVSYDIMAIAMANIDGEPHANLFSSEPHEHSSDGSYLSAVGENEANRQREAQKMPRGSGELRERVLPTRLPSRNLTEQISAPGTWLSTWHAISAQHLARNQRPAPVH